MIGPREPPLRYARGRMLVLVSCVMAVMAAAVLALGADDARLLRLGIVAALWAALIGTFRTTRMPREPDAARAGEPGGQVEPGEREEIVALRGELQSLRETLRNLLGGDLLVERVALQAESTRVRPLPAAEVSPPAQREPVEVAFRPGTGRADAGDGRAELDLPRLDIFAATAAELAGRVSFADPAWRPAVFSPTQHSSPRTSRYSSAPVATQAMNGTGSLGNGSRAGRHSGGPRRGPQLAASGDDSLPRSRRRRADG